MADRLGVVLGLLLRGLLLMSPEEQVIRDWLAGQLNPETGGPLPPSRRLSQPLPRRQVPAVVETLLGIIDQLRGDDPSPADVELPPRRFLTFAEVPVVAGVATLPSGYTVESTANVVRYPVCGAVSWADPSEICELEGGHTGGHYSETHAAIWSGPA